jgi:predicted phage tail protein
MKTFCHAALCVSALWVAACSPTHNWREWRLEGTTLVALMPCKPETATRQVPLAGATRALHMTSCEAGATKFALAWVDVGGIEPLPAAMAAWQEASLRSLRATTATPAAHSVANIAGASSAQAVVAQGVDPQGRPVQVRAVYFSQGTRVFQAAVYGASAQGEPVDTFFGGLRLGSL